MTFNKIEGFINDYFGNLFRYWKHFTLIYTNSVLNALQTSTGKVNSDKKIQT